MNKRIMSQILAGIVAIVSIAVMMGWILDIGVLKSILPGWVSMKFITSLSFFFSAILVMILAKKEKGEASNYFIMIISFALLLLMITFVISLFVGVSTGIEKLFVQEQPGAVRTTVPGVPAIPTMVCFILISLSGLIFLLRSGKCRCGIIFGALIALIGGVAVLGYIVEIPLMYYSFEGYTSMAAHTAGLFALLGIGLILMNEGGK
jgi:hypothetical protein